MGWPERSCTLCNIIPGCETGGEVLQSWHCLQTGWAVCSWEVVSAFPSLTSFSSSFFLSLPYEIVFILTHAFFLLLPFRLSPPFHLREKLGGCLVAGQGQPIPHRKALTKEWEGNGMHLTLAMALFFNAVGGNNQILIVRDWVEEVTIHFLFPICWCQQEASMDLKGVNKLVIVPVVWTN